GRRRAAPAPRAWHPRARGYVGSVRQVADLPPVPPRESGPGAARSWGPSTGKAAERRRSCPLAARALEQSGLMRGKSIGLPDLKRRPKSHKCRVLGNMRVRSEFLGEDDPPFRIEGQA